MVTNHELSILCAGICASGGNDLPWFWEASRSRQSILQADWGHFLRDRSRSRWEPQNSQRSCSLWWVTHAHSIILCLFSTICIILCRMWQNWQKVLTKAITMLVAVKAIWSLNIQSGAQKSGTYIHVMQRMYVLVFFCATMYIVGNKTKRHLVLFFGYLSHKSTVSVTNFDILMSVLRWCVQFHHCLTPMSNQSIKNHYIWLIFDSAVEKQERFLLPHHVYLLWQHKSHGTDG